MAYIEDVINVACLRSVNLRHAYADDVHQADDREVF
jgi:hypothetical protein